MTVSINAKNVPITTTPVLRNDMTYVSSPVFHEAIEVNTCDEYMICLEEKNLSKKQQISNGIKRINEETGLSEKYIQKLIDSEKLRLTVYDDGVKANKEDEHGTYTIGCGRTGLVPGWCFQDEAFDNDKLYKITDENKDLIKITPSMAMELLKEDLMFAKADAIAFFGEENFNNAPQSIRDAIVDIIFNKGLKAFNTNINPNSSTIKLKEDLKNKDYASAAAHVIYETKNLGLKKRNILRFTYAVADLSPEDKVKAKEMTNEYYQKVCQEYNFKTPRFNTGHFPKSCIESWKAEYHLNQIKIAWRKAFED